MARMTFDEGSSDGPGLDSLSHRVLVLNRNWQAVNVINAKRAFSLLFNDQAKVIAAHDESYQVLSLEQWLAFSMSTPAPEGYEFVRTIRLHIALPRILLLRAYDRLPVQEVKFNRQNVFERDEYCCQYCQESYRFRELTLDHVIPRDRGGRTSWENIVTCCKPCNNRKANRLPHEAGMKLAIRPQRPKWRPFVMAALGEGYADDAWSAFLHVEKSAS